MADTFWFNQTLGLIPQAPTEGAGKHTDYKK